MSDANAPATARIVNRNGAFSYAHGPDAVEAYRLKVMIVGFKLWHKTGIQPTRRVRILKLVQHTT